MVQVLKEASLTTPSARSSLPDGIHWRRLDAEVHLGYRKGKRSGVWLVRWRDGKGYRQASLGAADDTIKAGSLSFAKAEAAARAKVEEARTAALAASMGATPTVGSAVERYIAMRNARDSARKGREVKSDAAQRLGRYVLGQPAHRNREAVAQNPLAVVALHTMREVDLRDWLTGLPAEMKPSSKERLATDLRAALNAAYEERHETLPPAVPVAIKRGLRVTIDPSADDDDAAVGRDNQILSDRQIGALLSAARQVDRDDGKWDGDLFRLIVALAATGMRFSQIARMRVRDLQVDRRRALVPTSRKGRGLKATAFTPVPIGQDVVEILAPAAYGRDAGEVLLERWRYAQAPGSIEWLKDRRGSWQSSSEFSREWQTIKAAAGLPLADPYAFRHSSIVRAIRANLPIRLVAASHDTSVAMIERHYSRWIVDSLEELTARAVVPLVPKDENAPNIVRLTIGE